MHLFEFTTIANEKLYVNPLQVLFVGQDEAKGHTNVTLAAPMALKGQFVFATKDSIETVQQRISASMRG